MGASWKLILCSVAELRTCWRYAAFAFDKLRGKNEVILFHLSFPRFENQVDALSGDEVEWLPDGRQGWTHACRRTDIVETDDR